MKGGKKRTESETMKEERAKIRTVRMKGQTLRSL